MIGDQKLCTFCKRMYVMFLGIYSGKSQIDNLYADSSQEDRCAPRIRAKLPIQIRFESGEIVETTTRDISIAGVSALLPINVRRGGLSWVKLFASHEIPVKIMWTGYGVVGCAFENLLKPSELLELCGMSSDHSIEHAPIQTSGIETDLRFESTPETLHS